MVWYQNVASTRLLQTWMLLTALTATTLAEYSGGTPHDRVIALDDDSFQAALQDPANPFWFLKFYAPWCGHCKRLAPVLEDAAPELQGRMAIGTIDCTKHKKLCDKFKVRGYPTLKFALDGDVHEYPGGRDKKSIVNFAHKMSAPAVQTVATYEEALQFAEERTDEGVVFVGYDATAATGQKTLEEQLQSTTYGQVFAQTARKKKAFAYFLWLLPPAPTNVDESDNEDAVATGETGLERFVVNDAKQPKFVNRLEAGMKPRAFHPKQTNEPTTAELEAFVSAQNIATVTTIGPQNFQKIGNSGRPLAVAVVDFQDDKQVAAAKTELANYISETGPKQIVDKYYYGVIDGVRWNKFLEQFGIDSMPQYFVLDVPSKNYWQNATYTNIEGFLQAVHDGTIEQRNAKASKRSGILGKIEQLFIEHMPYSIVLLIVIIFTAVFFLVPSGDGTIQDELMREETQYLKKHEKESKKDK